MARCALRWRSGHFFDDRIEVIAGRDLNARC